MKKLRLKRWVKVVLMVIAVISGLVMMSDCEETTFFIVSHLIALGIFTLSCCLLSKYER